MKYNLSEIQGVIKDRRTIYPEDFSDRKVHLEQIETLINNAIWAPTHGMTQPWRFKVFSDGAKQKLADQMIQTYQKYEGDQAKDAKVQKYQTRIDKSSAIIAICMQKDPNNKIPEIEEVEATACSVQNMFLTATAYGLGCYWSSPKYIYENMMDEFLELSSDQVCLGFFYVGYPSDEWPKGQRKPIEYVSEWFDQ